MFNGGERLTEKDLHVRIKIKPRIALLAKLGGNPVGGLGLGQFRGVLGLETAQGFFQAGALFESMTAFMGQRHQIVRDLDTRHAGIAIELAEQFLALHSGTAFQLSIQTTDARGESQGFIEPGDQIGQRLFGRL